MAGGVVLAFPAGPASQEVPQPPPTPQAAPEPAPHPVSRIPPELLGNRSMSPPMSERGEPESDEEAASRLAELMPALQKASERYERYALRFTSDETLRTARYDPRSGEARSEKAKRYAYLLVFDEDRLRYSVLRQTLGKDDLPTGGNQEVNLPTPDAYAWTFLFSPRNQRIIHFRYLGREIKDYRLAHVIEFISAAPFVEGRDIREWSGTVWIEDRTFNFIRIEASPSFQDNRLAGQWRVYSESMQLPWGKTKPRPRGYELAVECNYTRDDMLFPTRVDLRDFVWVGRGREVTDNHFVLEYTDYRFFQTDVEERQSQPGSAPPEQ